jgi:hypothetical protein
MDQPNFSALWIFPFVFAVSAALIVWAVLAAKKRAQELSQLAMQLGFNFLGKTWQGPVLDPQHKTCLLQHTRGNFSNAMAGMSSRLETTVFDYTYSAGKSSISQTIVCFSHKVQLPPFTLRPEGFLDRIGNAFLHNDIDFDSNPEFSRRYALKSPDEAGTRRLFTPGLLSYMEQIPSEQHWVIEANGTNLFVYRGGRTVSPADLSTFLQETSAIAQTIFASEGLKSPIA